MLHKTHESITFEDNSGITFSSSHSHALVCKVIALSPGPIPSFSMLHAEPPVFQHVTLKKLGIGPGNEAKKLSVWICTSFMHTSEISSIESVDSRKWLVAKALYSF